MRVILWVLLLTACSASKPLPLPDGQSGHLINRCVDAAACYRRALELCPRGYDTVKEGTEMYGPAPRYMMILRCR